MDTLEQQLQATLLTATRMELAAASQAEDWSTCVQLCTTIMNNPILTPDSLATYENKRDIYLDLLNQEPSLQDWA